MKNISSKAKIFFLIIFIFFTSGFALFWFDYIGLVDLQSRFAFLRGEPPKVTDAADDEPTLVAREEFEKEKEKLRERIEDLDKREASISEKEKLIEADREKLEEMKKGLELEKKKLQQDKTRYAGYMKNVKQLADKIVNMPPEESVKIMVNWEETLIIDVLRQIDSGAEAVGKRSIASYLITLMPKEKASRIMYLMTQI